MMSLRTLRAAAVTTALVVACSLPATVRAQTADLLFSEYVEGSANNKAIEIFNGTEDVIDLSAYAIDRYSNGALTPVSIPLNAVDLEPGEVYVIVHDQADAALKSIADQLSADLNFNGNDACVLTVAGGQVIDSFGQVGVDPGSYWSCADGNTANHTLRRLSSICAGDVDPGDAFDPCEEYRFYPVDTFNGLGYHIADCGAVADETTSWGSLKSLYR